VGPQPELVEDRWRAISGIGKKVRFETIVIRVRDPVNSEIPTEVTGGGKVNPHVCISVSAYREIRGSARQVILDIVGAKISMEGFPIGTGER
jgi:hypothetical protein